MVRLDWQCHDMFVEKRYTTQDLLLSVWKQQFEIDPLLSLWWHVLIIRLVNIFGRLFWHVIEQPQMSSLWGTCLWGKCSYRQREAVYWPRSSPLQHSDSKLLHAFLLATVGTAWLRSLQWLKDRTHTHTHTQILISKIPLHLVLVQKNVRFSPTDSPSISPMAKVLKWTGS